MDHHNNNNWNALEEDSVHPVQPCENSNNDDLNAADQISDIDQSSNEVIIIRDSCDITEETTDTQVAASLQAALQVAISVVVNITIAEDRKSTRLNSSHV